MLLTLSGPMPQSREERGAGGGGYNEQDEQAISYLFYRTFFVVMVYGWYFMRFYICLYICVYVLER